MRFLQGLVLVGTIDLRPGLLPPISSPGGRGNEITDFRSCPPVWGGAYYRHWPGSGGGTADRAAGGLISKHTENTYFFTLSFYVTSPKFTVIKLFCPAHLDLNTPRMLDSTCSRACKPGALFHQVYHSCTSAWPGLITEECDLTYCPFYSYMSDDDLPSPSGEPYF